MLPAIKVGGSVNPSQRFLSYIHCMESLGRPLELNRKKRKKGMRHRYDMMWNKLKGRARKSTAQKSELELSVGYICILIHDSYAPYQFKKCASKFEAPGYKCTLVRRISCIFMHFTSFSPWESVLRRNWVSRGGPIATQSMLQGRDGMTTDGSAWLTGSTAHLWLVFGAGRI